MDKNSKINIIYDFGVIGLMIFIYILLLSVSSSYTIVQPVGIFPFFYYIDIVIHFPSELKEFLLIICLIYPFITLIISIKLYYSIKYAIPLFVSGLAFLFFEGAWVKFPNLFILLSSVYFLIGTLLIGYSLWLESDLLIIRHPEAFEEKEEQEPESMDIQLSEDDYKDEVKFWMKMLGSSDDKFREEAIISLGEIGDERALPYLEKLLDDKSHSIRNLTRKAIIKIKYKGNSQQ